MARIDSLRWDARYQERNLDHCSSPRQFLIEVADMLPTSGKALDIAMGLGINGAYLAERGFSVIGVDISFVALKKAKKHYPYLNMICADLELFSFPPATFDVIINFYYLERSLWNKIRSWLKPEGLLIFETLLIDMLEFKSNLDKRFLLKPNELYESFSDFEILLYREGWTERESGRPRAVASMLAKKPS